MLEGMHRSRLSTVLLDVPGPSVEATVAFWTAALDLTSRVVDGHEAYRDLGVCSSGLGLLVQEIAGTARVHLDIETDDIDAEVARLVRHGATRVQAVESWQVLRDPAGLLFCVVRVQDPSRFEAEAITWDEK